jgi:ribosomal protein S27AE
MQWLGSPGNAGRAMLEDMMNHSEGTVYLDDDKGDSEHPCHKCEYSMVLIAEHAFMELWECPQCGYLERVRQ